MRAWVYKVNSKRPGKLTGWHFDQYFGYRGFKPCDMGGEGWIRSPQSWLRLRQVKKGDLFVCYQSDERRIYGLAVAASNGYEQREGTGRFCCVDFEPGGLRLHRPLHVAAAEHRALFGHVGAFTVPSRGTIHALAADERRLVLDALARTNADQQHDIEEWLAGHAPALAGRRTPRRAKGASSV